MRAQRRGFGDRRAGTAASPQCVYVGVRMGSRDQQKWRMESNDSYPCPCENTLGGYAFVNVLVTSLLQMH